MARKQRSDEKETGFLDRESSRGEANWPKPREITEEAIDEICRSIGIPASRRAEFGAELKAVQTSLSELIADMKQRGTNSLHRDNWINLLSSVTEIVHQLEVVERYERSREGRVHLESPVVGPLSRATAIFLPALLDPRLLLSIERSTPPHIDQMNRTAHMSWLRQFGSVHHAAALLPVFTIIRDNLIAPVAEEMHSLTKSSRRPQNVLGPGLLRVFSNLCIEYLPGDDLVINTSGQIYKLAMAFCQNTVIPTQWIKRQFNKTVPEYVRKRLENNMPQKS